MSVHRADVIVRKVGQSPAKYTKGSPVAKTVQQLAGQKTIQRVKAGRLQIEVSAHLSEHNLSEPCQSAYKRNHSVETALLCVQNDILKAMDN